MDDRKVFNINFTYLYMYVYVKLFNIMLMNNIICFKLWQPCSNFISCSFVLIRCDLRTRNKQTLIKYPPIYHDFCQDESAILQHNFNGPLCFRVVGAMVVGAAVCSRIPGLAKSQREQCRKAPHAMPAVGEGAALGLRECRHQFRHHRWNCSHVSSDQVFGHVVVVGKKDCPVTARAVFITPCNVPRNAVHAHFYFLYSATSPQKGETV